MNAEIERSSLNLFARVHRGDEARLVKAARSGNQLAFAGLCERCAHRLLRVAHRITRNREDAEDAVQEALLRAFAHIADFHGKSSFSTWLTRIAINSALMIVRKRRLLSEVPGDSSTDCSEDGFFSAEVADRAPSPESRYLQAEEERILKKAILHLRPSLRRVVETRGLQELSIRETAEAMGISEGTAKARLFHAKTELRKSSVLRAIWLQEETATSFARDK